MSTSANLGGWMARAGPSTSHSMRPAWTRAAGMSSPAHEGGDGVGLGRAGHGEDGEARRIDGGQRQGEARMGVHAVGVLRRRHQFARARLERRRPGEQRRRVPVGPHARDG